MQMKTHGGDVYGVAKELGVGVEDCLDFSANIGPLGIPVKVKTAMEQAIAESIHYPDPECRKLTGALGARLQVKPETILCGNGGADILYRIVYAAKPKKPCFPRRHFWHMGRRFCRWGRRSPITIWTRGWRSGRISLP